MMQQLSLQPARVPLIEPNAEGDFAFSIPLEMELTDDDAEGEPDWEMEGEDAEDQAICE